jgi:hypothetical protein
VSTSRARRGAATEESAVNGYRLGAVITQILSWLTTLWFCEWIGQPKDDAAWWRVVVISIGVEFLLVQLKRLVHNKKKGFELLGWIGIVVDSVCNAGGAFGISGRILTFPPVAAVLLYAKVNVYDTTTNMIGSFVVAMVAGYLLSIAPLRLWNAGAPK